MAKCNSCGAPVSGNAWKCQQCGSEAASSSMIVGKLLVVGVVVVCLGVFVSVLA